MTPATADRTTDVDRFLQHAAPDWRMGGGPHQVMHRHTAERILRGHPDVANANFVTRVVCGDRDGVERMLAERPGAARDVFGPKHWPPLLYLCAGRLTLPSFADNSVALARLLLDRGADPSIANGAGKTPLERAVAGGHEAVAALLS